jgi:hypothetical protein
VEWSRAWYAGSEMVEMGWDGMFETFSIWIQILQCLNLFCFHPKKHEKMA